MNTKIWKSDTVLHVAARYFDYYSDRILEHFISKGANINAKNDIGYAPLHVAAEKNKHWVVKILLENGADMNINPISTATPFSTEC